MTHSLVHRQSELFFADLSGQPLRRRRPPPPASEIADEEWGEAVAQLPSRYRTAVDAAEQAEEILDEAEQAQLTIELFAVHDQAGLDEFVGKIARSVKRAASKAVRDVGRTPIARTVSRAATDIGRSKLARSVGRAATDVSRGVAKVGAAVPMLGTAAKLVSRATPLGALARATYGAASAALRGQNIFMGAVDGLAGTPLFAAAIQVARGVIRGENLLAATKLAVKAGISDAREALRFAAMVAPFIPGIGTGVGAALGAADALANGQPITKALIAGVRGAIPGGVIAQAAFDTAAELAQGKRLDQALLTAARNRLPPGPAQAAFDTGLALAQGQKLQHAMVQGASKMLPPSPYSADAMAFAKRALAGDNLGQAALSTAGQAVLNRARQQGNDLVSTVQGRAVAAAAARVPAVRVPPSVAKRAAALPRPPVTLDGTFAASNSVVRVNADRFATELSGRVNVRG